MGFIVDPERVVMPVSAFYRMYIDITADAEEPLPFTCKSNNAPCVVNANCGFDLSVLKTFSSKHATPILRTG